MTMFPKPGPREKKLKLRKPRPTYAQMLKKSKSGYKKLVEKVDHVFANLIRVEHADESGSVKCVTCDHVYHYKQARSINCGHFRRRIHWNTRWDKRNCAPQCAHCNCWDLGSEIKFAAYIDRVHGEGMSERLRILSLMKKQWKRYELEYLLETFTEQLQALKTAKGLL